MAGQARLVRVDAHDDGLNSWEMRRFAPSRALNGLVAGYTDYAERTTDFTIRRELPHGEGVLIVNLGAPIEITGGDGLLIRLSAGQAVVAGFHLRPALSSSSGEQRGIQIDISLPALRRLLGLPMDTLLDRTIPLEMLLGRTAHTLGQRLADTADATVRIALLEAELLAVFASRPQLTSSQLAALQFLKQPDAEIMDVARTIGWSRKHLSDRVRDAVGVGPRSYRRVLRFDRAVGSIRRGAAAQGWAGLAAEAGYYDQSHMIREFKELAGMTPAELVRHQIPDGGGFAEN